MFFLEVKVFIDISNADVSHFEAMPPATIFLGDNIKSIQKVVTGDRTVRKSVHQQNERK